MQKGLSSSILCQLHLLVLAVLLGACSTPGSRLFGKRTPHEAYGNRLKEAGLGSTALGVKWTEAAQRSLKEPVRINIPYKESGYFASERPEAAGFVFSAKRGEKMRISIAKTPPDGFLLFIDLYLVNDNEAPDLLESADTSNPGITYEVKEDGNYLLRIQPELLKSGGYTVEITTSASLSFPVSAAGNDARIGSFWGNSRDNGARSHEGIDIFSKFRTPVVAAADGIVTRVGENGLGGKVVFMRPYRKNYSLYYAHLDSQVVSEGQAVKTGDTLGLMGNTGNAKTTPPHLHFGIYTSSGAIDPLPFVKRSTEKPAAVTAPMQGLNHYGYNSRTTRVFDAPTAKAGSPVNLDGETPLFILAATAGWYKVKLPDGKTGFVFSSNVKTEEALRKLTIDTATLLFEQPADSLSPKKWVAKGMQAEILGLYNQYYLARVDSVTGWMKK